MFFKKKEVRAEKAPSYDDPILNAIFGTNIITKEMALQIPTISGAIDLISNIVASTPIKLFKDIDGKAVEVKIDSRLQILNEETGDTLNSSDFWKAITHDFYLGKGGYAYINKEKGSIKSLHYIDESNVTILKNSNPIFKDFDINILGKAYKPYDFLKILRNTKDGAQGTPITVENSKLINVAYCSLAFELNMAKRGGNKKGFLKSEKKLDEPSLNALKEAFRRLYSADGEGTDNFVLLNNGIDFKESSNTSVEMQLNENKLTNAEEFAKIFHISTDILSGKAENARNLAKLAAIPLMTTIQCALNKDLLLEKEKPIYYFAFDTKELLKGDIAERFSAYKTALDSNFMGIDEVRYAEDLEPLGLNWIKLGLQDVLYNPITKEIFTPNTGKSANMDNTSALLENDKFIKDKNTETVLQSYESDDILEENRAQARDKNGRFAGGSGGGKTKYAPSAQRNKAGIQVSPAKYSKLCGISNTKYPNASKDDNTKAFLDAKYVYDVTPDGYGGIIINSKIKIK